MGLCLRLPTWSAPVAIPIFRRKRRKPFALYVLASFWDVMTWPIRVRKKSIIAEWSCRRDIGQGGLLLPSNRRDTNGRSKSVPQRLKAVRRVAIYGTAEAVPFVTEISQLVEYMLMMVSESQDFTNLVP
jgi:hypothetical protein